MIKLFLFFSLFLLVTSENCEKCSEYVGFFCTSGKYASLEGCGYGDDCLCPCSCSCTDNKDCNDGYECIYPTNVLTGFPGNVLACIRKEFEETTTEDCVENCDTATQCKMLKQTCALFPEATCITDNCKCSAKLDVNGVEPKCNPDADEESPEYFYPEDFFPIIVQNNTNPPVTHVDNFEKDKEADEPQSSQIWIPIVIVVVVLVVLIVAYLVWLKQSKKEASTEKEKDIKEKEPLNAGSV